MSQVIMASASASALSSVLRTPRGVITQSRRPRTLAAQAGSSDGPRMQELKMDSPRPENSNGSGPSTSASPSKPKYTPRAMIKPKNVSFFDSMKFGGPAPEIINGRLAMIGFVASVYQEVTTGATIEQQVFSNPIPAAVTAVIVSYATLVPIMKGCKNEAFGFMSPRAETANGRAAMLAFMVMLVLELRTGIPFF